MTELLIPGFYLMAGIMAYAMLHHFYLAFKPSCDTLELLFGFMCLVTVPFAIFHAQQLQAIDLPGFVTALKCTLSSAILFFAVLPWFIALYTGRWPWFFLSAVTLLFAIVFIANLILPFSVQFEQLDGISTQILPWGETIVRGDGHFGVWIYPVIAGVIMVFGFTSFALISKYLASRDKSDLYMVLAVGLFFVTTIFGILVRLSIIKFVEPGPLGVLAMLISMNEILIQKKSAVEKEFFKLKNWQQTLLDSADYSIITTDAEGKITSFNSSAERMLGYRPEELIGRHTPVIFHDMEEIIQRAAELSKELSKTILPDFEVFVAKIMMSHPEEREWIFIRQDGSRLCVRLSVTALYGNSGKITGYMMIATDLTERNQTQSNLLDSNAKYRALFDSAGEGIFLLDGVSIVDCNPAIFKMFACTREQIINESPYRFSPVLQPDGQPSKKKALKKITEAYADGSNTFEWQHCRYDGTVFDAEVCLTSVQIGEKNCLLVFVRDITERKAVENKIKFLAFYDALTNLPNRQLLLTRLQQALASCTRSGRHGAVMFINLDNFKSLNDTLGHLTGDKLLQQVAKRLTDCIREGDTVARLGSDEFVMILEDLSEQTINALEQTCSVGEKVLSALGQMYQLGAHEIRSSASIGVNIFNGEQKDLEALLQQADIAMFHAKKAGRNTLKFFDPQMQEAINLKMAMEGELRKALELGQFHLHYQLQVDRFRRPVGAEALIRWLHPERGMVPPGQFIPLSEETGQILHIGLWVLETACAQLKRWERDKSTRDLTLAVNVSARQFHQMDFVAQVQATLERHAINPRLLKLELTESFFLKDVEETVVTMNGLKKIGVMLSLDDFGTGYSSLQYLKRLPLDQIKIDQSFVRNIAADPNDAVIVGTIIAMAGTLELEVIAEGVETEEQHGLLERRDCHTFQGYLFGKPMPIERFEALLKQ